MGVSVVDNERRDVDTVIGALKETISEARANKGG